MKQREALCVVDESIDVSNALEDGENVLKKSMSASERPLPMSLSSEDVVLSLAELHVRFLLDYSKLGIIKIQNQTIVYANEAMAQLCNLERDALLQSGQNILFSKQHGKVIDELFNMDPPSTVCVLDDMRLLTVQIQACWWMPSVFQEQPCVQIMFDPQQARIEKIAEEPEVAQQKDVEPSRHNNNAPMISKELSANAVEVHTMVAELHAAFKEKRFRILFQPIACLTGGEDAHYEIVLRLISNEGEEVAAGDFIEHIDAHALATKVDRWVILQAVKSLLTHPNKANLFIHLSMASVLDATFIPWLHNVLKKSSIAPETLIFQITEAVVCRHIQESQALLRALKVMGCRINLVQFEVKEETDTLLASDQFDYVKLHSHFTRELTDNRNSEQEVRLLIEKLHHRKLKVIVPHVETPNIMTQLWRCGVDYVQGYFLQRPLAHMNYDFSSDA